MAVAAVVLVCAVAGVAGACGASSAHPRSARAADDPAPPEVLVTLGDGGCSPTELSLPAGPVVFKVTNPGTTRVSEMEVQSANGHVVNDVEGVGPGRTRSFVVNLRAGLTYRVRCPETALTGGIITVR